MAKFHLSFLVGFSLVLDKKVTKKSKKKTSKINLKKSKSSTSLKSSVKSKGKTKRKRQENTEFTLPKNAILVDKPIAQVHIEYNLFPDVKSKYQIDALCWGTVAKIFTKDDSKIIKPYISNEISWVPICIEHSLNNISLEEIHRLHSHVIEFQLSGDVKKISKQAKSEKTKMFFTSNHFGNQVFVDLYDYDPNTKRTVSSVKYEFPKKTNVLEKEAKFFYSDPYKNYLYESINMIINKKNIIYKEFANVCPPPSTDDAIIKKIKQDSNKKSKKDKVKKEKAIKKKNKKKKDKCLKIIVPGEVFFTDPYFTKYKASTNETIPHFSVVINVLDLLSEKLKLQLAPFIIKINKIINFPDSYLKSIGFHSVYITYDVPYIAKCVSLAKPIENDINFYESHIFFNTHETKLLKLLEFLQTGQLTVKIYGVNGNIKNKNVIDSDLSTIYRSKLPFKSPCDGDTLLAVGNVSMNSLLKYHCAQTKIIQCHSLEYYSKKTHRCINFDWNNITTNKVNLITMDNIARNSSLPEHDLLKFSTNLLVESQLLAFPIVTLASRENPIYSRCCFRLSNKIDAYKLIETILRRNKKDVGDLITGFVIEDDDSVICFFEGIFQGFISSIIYSIKSKIEKGTFLFNSDLIFEKRLYGTFTSVTYGIYKVILKESIQDILLKNVIYIRFNLPILCLQALMKLNMLLKGNKMQLIIQDKLFLLPEEIVCLNLEWGILEDKLNDL